MRNPFRRKAEPTGDMRDTPVDNPLDFRADGSIHAGDPAWEAMMEIMNSGESAVFNQRKDGTWSKS